MNTHSQVWLVVGLAVASGLTFTGVQAHDAQQARVADAVLFSKPLHVLATEVEQTTATAPGVAAALEGSAADIARVVEIGVAAYEPYDVRYFAAPSVLCEDVAEGVWLPWLADDAERACEEARRVDAVAIEADVWALGRLQFRSQCRARFQRFDESVPKAVREAEAEAWRAWTLPSSLHDEAESGGPARDALGPLTRIADRIEDAVSRPACEKAHGETLAEPYATP